MLAAQMQAAGVVQGQLVGVVMPKGWRQVVAVLAVGLAGAAYVPLELPLPRGEDPVPVAARRGGVGVDICGAGWARLALRCGRCR